ncbi:MAG: Glyoxalase/bleomycin resistance protein/dioxygenase [Verrucomicrobiales bacterium]|nr:Glyoxalase/bleomycin resistance protein/dioxygenase [Verrucomicrobiales bacterium]
MGSLVDSGMSHNLNPITLNLVVLKSLNPVRAVKFYTCLGLNFTSHRHGKGPEHWAAEMSGGVFEIYPQTPETPSTLGTRVGFRVPSVDSVIGRLIEFPDSVVSPTKDSEWGRRAVLVDPDGHKVELLEG